MEQEVISLGEYWGREIGWLLLLFSFVVLTAQVGRQNILLWLRNLPTPLRTTLSVAHIVSLLIASVITALFVATVTAHTHVILIGGPAKILSQILSMNGTLFGLLILATGVGAWLVTLFQLWKTSKELDELQDSQTASE